MIDKCHVLFEQAVRKKVPIAAVHVQFHVHMSQVQAIESLKGVFHILPTVRQHDQVRDQFQFEAGPGFEE